eukprot:8205727-Prorocentrum_lima.AAC.1
MAAALLHRRKRVTKEVKPLLPSWMHVSVDPVQKGGCNRAMISVSWLVQGVQAPCLAHAFKGRELLLRGITSPAPIRDAIMKVLHK